MMARCGVCRFSPSCHSRLEGFYQYSGTKPPMTAGRNGKASHTMKIKFGRSTASQRCSLRSVRNGKNMDELIPSVRNAVASTSINTPSYSCLGGEWGYKSPAVSGKTNEIRHRLIRVTWMLCRRGQSLAIKQVLIMHADAKVNATNRVYKAHFRALTITVNIYEESEMVMID